MGDLPKIEQEIARLRAFDDTMRAAGIPVDMLEDMFDCSYELLDRIKAAIEVGDDTQNTVLHAMNNEGDSSCVLYHFKASYFTTSPRLLIFSHIHPLTLCRA